MSLRGADCTRLLIRATKRIRAAHHWMRDRDARAEPFLSGMFTRGEVVYAGSEAEAAHAREPVAIFTGEVLPLYAADRDDDGLGYCSTNSRPKSGGSSNR